MLQPDQENVPLSNQMSLFMQLRYFNNFFLPLYRGRIVVVSSALYNMVKVFDFDDVMATKGYTLFGQYSASKFANTVFAVEMQRR
jgi:hypothetical protein